MKFGVLITCRDLCVLTKPPHLKIGRDLDNLDNVGNVFALTLEN